MSLPIRAAVRSLPNGLFRLFRASGGGSRSLRNSINATRNDAKTLSIPSTSDFSRNLYSAPGKDFENAKTRLQTGAKNVDNQTQLRLYALFKQVTVGPCNKEKPGMMDFVGKAKWEAWNELGKMSQGEAEKAYISLVEEIIGTQEQQKYEGSSSSPPVKEVEGLKIEVKNKVRTITLNRPKKKNALTREMYNGIGQALHDANTDDNTNIIVITGTGDYFCSGNDLANFMNVTDPAAVALESRDLLETFVSSFIDCTKPLVAVINGPAVGIAVTTLGLYDTIFCSDKATFSTPFSALGQSPEGCASYTFPRIMGYAKASELLYFNQKITAAQAEQCGLVTKVIHHAQLEEVVEKRIKEMAELPIKSLVYSKELVRGREKQMLHEINATECDRLAERWQSEDCMNAIMKFFSKKAKI